MSSHTSARGPRVRKPAPDPFAERLSPRWAPVSKIATYTGNRPKKIYGWLRQGLIRFYQTDDGAFRVDIDSVDELIGDLAAKGYQPSGRRRPGRPRKAGSNPKSKSNPEGPAS
jgi:hypothetical protein